MNSNFRHAVLEPQPSTKRKTDTLNDDERWRVCSKTSFKIVTMLLQLLTLFPRDPRLGVFKMRLVNYSSFSRRNYFSLLGNQRLLTVAPIVGSSLLQFSRTVMLLSSSAQKEDQEDDGSRLLDGNSKVSSLHPRNKKLAAVIREGLFSLNKSAIYIQESVSTRRPLFPTNNEEEEEEEFDNKPNGESQFWGKRRRMAPSSDRQSVQEYTLMTVARECLEEWSRKHPNSLFTLHGDPITFVDIEVSKDLKQAVLYWALPDILLYHEKLTVDQKDLLMQRLDEQLQAKRATAQLRRLVYARLSSYYPPKITLKAAPRELWEDLLREFDV